MLNNDNKLQMEKILDELSNLRSRHQQLLSQISEPHNQETIMELQFLIEEKISTIKFLVTPNPKNNGVQNIPRECFALFESIPCSFYFHTQTKTSTRTSLEFWGNVGSQSSYKHSS